MTDDEQHGALQPCATLGDGDPARTPTSDPAIRHTATTALADAEDDTVGAVAS